MEGNSVFGKNELTKQYSAILKEVIGWYDKPGDGIISYVSEKFSYYTGDILSELDEMLMPNSPMNLVNFALEARKDSQIEFLFPLEALPQHTQTLLKNRLSETRLFKYLSVPLYEQMRSIDG
jgi:ubiquinone biosynthesis protein COQ9